MRATLSSIRNSLTILKVIFISSLIFHTLILTRIIPFSFVWGGRLQSVEDMYAFETVSIVLNSIFLAMTVICSDEKKRIEKEIFLKWVFRVMTLLFALNTLGNIFANNNLERFFFAPLTGLMALLCLHISKSIGSTTQQPRC